MNFPDTSNGDVFRRLAKNNIKFGELFDVEFFAILATENMADTIAKQYVNSKYQMVNIETRPFDDGRMELELIVKVPLTYENICLFEDELQNRVSSVDGYLDGWGILT